MSLLTTLGLMPPEFARFNSAGAEGGIASITDLEQDMRDILQNWRDAATDGVDLFVTSVLSERIDDLESGSWTAFVTALIGNTIWAAAAFTPVGAPAFAVSLAGIGVAAVPTLPDKKKNLIPAIQKRATGYIYSIYAKLDRGLRGKAQKLVGSQFGIGRYRAIALFVEASFAPGLFSIDAKHATVPTLAMDRIRDRSVGAAKALFDQHVAKARAERTRRDEEAARTYMEAEIRSARAMK